MNNKIVFVITVLLVQALLVVDSYPSGAGGCGGGKAAVGGFHLSKFLGLRTVRSRNLTAANIELLVGDSVIEEGAIVNRVRDVDHPITVQAKDGTKFLGFLIRIEKVDGSDATGALTAGTGQQIARVCKTPVTGITHIQADKKTAAGGTIKFTDVTVGVRVGVTVVFRNKLGGSSYAYGNYTLNFVNP